MNDVVKFIDGFRDKGNAEIVFSGDCSYWFAVILYHRFIRDGAKIMYHPKTNQFGTMIHCKLYNITGIIEEKTGWISWLGITDKSARQMVTDTYIMF